MVIRYDYLWASEERDGYSTGEKHRPCAVVVALPAAPGTSAKRAYVCGITHSKPVAPSEGIEIPAKVKTHMGLDDQPSWVITNEANKLDWNDRGIVRTATGKWDYGFLPREFMAQIIEKMKSRCGRGDFDWIARPGPSTGPGAS